MAPQCCQQQQRSVSLSVNAPCKFTETPDGDLALKPIFELRETQMMTDSKFPPCDPECPGSLNLPKQSWVGSSPATGNPRMQMRCDVIRVFVFALKGLFQPE